MKPLIHSLLDKFAQDLSRTIELRQALHSIPEPGNQEWRTAEILRRALGSTSHELNTATIVHIGPVDKGSVILRAELDGLEIRESAHSSYVSTNDWMHACGHDINMAALVGTVATLRAFESQLPIGVSAVFQPAEEIHPSGARYIVDNAKQLFINPIAAIAVHPHPDVPVHHVAVGEGTINACSDSLEITVEGTGGHGAYPHRANDVVVAMSAVIMAIQQVVSRRIDPLEPVAVSIGKIHGGTAANIMPEVVTCIGTVRAMTTRGRQTLHQILDATIVATAAAYGCRATVRFESGEPPLSNSPELAHAFRHWALQTSIPIASPLVTMGADDFSLFEEIAPILMVFAGAPSQIREVQLHHPEYLPSDDVVSLVAAAYCCGVAAAYEMTTASDGLLPHH